MTRSLAVVAGVVALALRQRLGGVAGRRRRRKRCYSSGESVNLLGAGFSPRAAPASPATARSSARSTPTRTAPSTASSRSPRTAASQTKTYTATDRHGLVDHRLGAAHGQRGARGAEAGHGRAGPGSEDQRARLHDRQDAVGAHHAREVEAQRSSSARLKGACGNADDAQAAAAAGTPRSGCTRSSSTRSGATTRGSRCATATRSPSPAADGSVRVPCEDRLGRVARDGLGRVVEVRRQRRAGRG